MSPNLKLTPTVLLDAPYLRMVLRAEQRSIRLTWNGHALSKEYRHGLSVALVVLREHDVRYWLADLRNMTAILHADEQWANEVWFPQLFTTGLRRMAIVESRDFFNQTSVARSFTAVNGKLSFEVAWFGSPEEATAWMERDQTKSV